VNLLTFDIDDNNLFNICIKYMTLAIKFFNNPSTIFGLSSSMIKKHSRVLNGEKPIYFHNVIEITLVLEP
jgi:hypothetical protein